MDNFGHTCLTRAIQEQKEDVVEYLVQEGGFGRQHGHQVSTAATQRGPSVTGKCYICYSLILNLTHFETSCPL